MIWYKLPPAEGWAGLEAYKLYTLLVVLTGRVETLSTFAGSRLDATVTLFE